MTPYEYYTIQCQHGSIMKDKRQLAALESLQKVFTDLLHEHQKRTHFLASFRKPRLVKGLYLWGSVGIGKTFLMDCFYHCLPFPKKMRMHFHEFMRLIHSELKKHQGKKNPLQIIAKELAQKTMLLCFDELFVTDITDAMILARLFNELFLQGVCLVATSNTAPDELYKNGLQRKLFLPAIALLKAHTHVLHLSSLDDYRLRHPTNACVFYTPNDLIAHENMESYFRVLAKNNPIQEGQIEVIGRSIPIKKQAADIVWFDFNVICGIPRSQQDYLHIAEAYRTVFISDIPIIPPEAKNTISLFIRLVDVFYNAHIRLVCSSADIMENIYTQGYLAFEYTRTLSRLMEMQSEDYFSKCAS